jgi:CBS domain containing-hemolysin-like protein
MPTWGMWIILAFLLSIRGMLAATEAALLSVSELRIRQLAKEGSKRAQRVARLKADPDSLTAVLRSGQVLCGFTAAAIGVLVPPRLLDVSLSHIIESSWLVWLTPLSSAFLVALLATLVDVTFRSSAAQKPESWALSLSWLARLSTLLLAPFINTLIALLNLAGRPFDARVSFQAPPPSLEELEKQLIKQAQHADVDKGAPQLIRSIFELSDKSCRDVMVPRTEIIALDASTSIDDILQLIAEENHSRIPVYQHDIDHIVGILHVRDIVPMLQHPDLIVLKDLLRPAVYVPWVKPIGDLLREMQRARIHMAVVVDEYGGFSGIVTLEDILREIVGDIGDEFEQQTSAFEKQADGSFVIDAMLPVGDFTSVFDCKIPDGEFETVGGFLASLAGAIPEVNDRFSVNGWTFYVASKDGPRLGRLRVVKPTSLPLAERRPSNERLESVVLPP